MSFDNKEIIGIYWVNMYVLVCSFLCYNESTEKTSGNGKDFTKYMTKCFHCKFLCAHSYNGQVAACRFAVGKPATHMQNSNRNQTFLRTRSSKLLSHHQWFPWECLCLKLRMCLRALRSESQRTQLLTAFVLSSFETTKMIMTLSWAVLLSWCILGVSKLEQYAVLFT